MEATTMNDRTLVLLVIFIVLLVAGLLMIADEQSKTAVSRKVVRSVLSEENLELARQAREWERMAKRVTRP